MSDHDEYLQALSEDFEIQNLGSDLGEPQDSESPESSTTSNVAEGSRRPARIRTVRSGITGPSRTMRPGYTKVRTGCVTCKQRKIKCDEEKPVCTNCINSKRRCWFSPPRANIFEPTTTQFVPSESLAERLLRYFAAVTAQRLASHKGLRLDLAFWQTVVPSMARRSAPIQYAMLALAAMQENEEARALQPAGEEPGQAWRLYGAAVGRLRFDLRSESISHDASLLCCLLLTLCHLWDLDLLQCFKHVFAGLHFCEQIRAALDSANYSQEAMDGYGAMLIPAFQYFAHCGGVLLDEMDETQSAQIYEFGTPVQSLQVPSTFTKGDDAYAAMDKLLREISGLGRTASTLTWSAELQAYLSLFESSLRQGLMSAESEDDNGLTADLRMLQVHNRAAVILFDGLRSESEMTYDRHLANFRYIVSEMRDLLQVYARGDPFGIRQRGVHIGMIPPLFLTATKCRDWATRHQALDLLHLVPHEEYVWTSCMAQQIAAEVVRQEEMADVVSTPMGEYRISLQALKFNASESQIEMSFSVRTGARQNYSSLAIEWQQNTAPTIRDTFWMPQSMLKMCGYSTLMISSRKTICRCGEVDAAEYDAVQDQEG